MNGDNPDEISSGDVEEIKEFYDSVYYADASADKVQITGHYRGLLRRLPLVAGQQVLDVACGTGSWLKVCTDAGAAVSGIDLSERAIAVCRESLPSGTFHAQAAESLPFADNTFDLITCLGSLEHFVDPVASLREMVRVAKGDAIFVLLVPNKDFLTRKLGLFGGTYQVDAKEVVRTLEEWDGLFARASLTVEERWRDLHVISKSWIVRGPFYAWPFRMAQALLLAVWPLRWQYQVYHRCTIASSGAVSSAKHS